MAVMKIWAGSSASNLTELPSPIEVKPTAEIIWSENTGRVPGSDMQNRGKMIGDVVAEKRTYAIRWGVLTSSELNTIKNKLKAGFFYFGVGSSEPSSPGKYYRSEISYEIIQAGNGVRYKDVSVSVIEQ